MFTNHHRPKMGVLMLISTGQTKGVSSISAIPEIEKQLGVSMTHLILQSMSMQKFHICS